LEEGPGAGRKKRERSLENCLLVARLSGIGSWSAPLDIAYDKYPRFADEWEI